MVDFASLSHLTWVVGLSNLLSYGEVSDLIYNLLEIKLSHWPFSDQFKHLANRNPFWSAIFPVHFQWNSNQ